MPRLIEVATLVLLLAMPARAQEPVSMATTVSRGRASITFEFADSPSLALTVENNRLTLGGRHNAAISVGSEWARAFRELTSRLADLDPQAAYEALSAWKPPQDGPTAASLLGSEDLVPAPMIPPGVPIAVPPLPPQFEVLVGQGPDRLLTGPVSIDRDETHEGDLVVAEGDVTVAGAVEGDVVALQGDVRLRRGAHVDGDVVAVFGRVRNDGASVGGRVVSRAARAAARPSAFGYGMSVLGVVIALALIGSGLLVLAPRPLAVGVETITAAPGRAFAAGLVAQALLLPTLVMLVVGLCITIVGIIAVPFAVLGYVLLTMAALLGGFLAVSHIVGERFAGTPVFQRLPLAAQGTIPPVVVGLALFGVLWLGAALLGSVPVAGWIILAIAALVTWLALTFGLGGALLSRLGIRDAFAGRAVPLQITDEYLWPTPIGSPAQRGVRSRGSKEEG